MEKLVQQLIESQQQFFNHMLEEQKALLAGVTKQASSSLEQVHGTVPPFVPYNKEETKWETYFQQLEQHFNAYGVVSTEKKRAYFLSWVGTATFELLQKLFGSVSIAEQDYSALTRKLSEYFKPIVHVSTKRYEFFQSRMKPNESYSEWVANLRGLARNCEFVCTKGDCKTEYVDQMIRDMIIVHTPHDSVRAAALQKVNPSLTEVLTIAESFESAQKSMQTMRCDDSSHTEINHIRKSETTSSQRSQRGRSKERKFFTNSKVKSCSGCYVSHKREKCKFRSAVCKQCGKVGHIMPVCLTGRSQSRSRYRNSADSVHCLENVVSVNELRKVNRNLFADVRINGHKMDFLLDTGASCSLIGLSGYDELKRPALNRQSNHSLVAYGNASVPLLGEITVNVEFSGRYLRLPLLVANVECGKNIFGLNWAEAFGMQINFENSFIACSLSSVTTAKVEELCSKYSDLFAPTLGLCSSVKAHLHLKANARPRFHKARPIPFAQLDSFKREAKRLEDLGIWKPIRFSEWAAPIVIVNKRNNKIRVCGDFKVTINPQLEIDQHPIPRPEDLFHKLANGQCFSKIDMSDAYLQLELDDESKALAVVNTPLGLYQYQRLPFGIASAPAIYQKTLEAILAGLNCAIYLDDILVTGRDEDEHINNLDAVFKRLAESGLRVNRDKCLFMRPEVEYLGHIVSAQGIRPSDSGIEAIKKLQRPRNLKELQAFMGKANYYNKFISNFAQRTAPLNLLRKKNVAFHWSIKQEKAFQDIKNQIISASQLAHFCTELPIILATDASSHGVGAVISHTYPDGSERPIAFASKTLDVHQQKYSQIEKEALAIIYGVTKFHQYLYGRNFILFTDHKPLVSLFKPDSKLPTMTTNRLQRWALTLMGYNYSIRFKPTAQHANADALSRLPSGPDAEFDKQEESCLEISAIYEEQLNDFPISPEKIGQHTTGDKVLNRIREYIRIGWPECLPKREKHLQAFFNRRLALTLQDDVVILQTDYPRVVIPQSLRAKVLRMLHEGHWGVVRMKQLARRYCWWPFIDKEIEQQASTCRICQTHSADPPKEYSNWPVPEKPWQRVHIDFAGPFINEMWLICIDAYSKFPFIVPMHRTTTEETIRALSKIFALEGLPEAIVSDNGTQFTASNFQEFCKRNGIQHLRTAPFHPASNGEAERFVRTFKTSLKKCLEEEKKKDDALSKCLITFRNTPNPRTGKTPAELLHGRTHRTLLSQLVPNQNKPYLAYKAHDNPKFQQYKQRRQSPRHSAKAKRNHHNQYLSSQPIVTQQERKFLPHQKVYARNYAGGPRWIEATIIKQMGSRLYIVNTHKGRWRRHQNQLKPRTNDSTEEFPIIPFHPGEPRSTPELVPQASNIDNESNSPTPSSTTSPQRSNLKQSSPECLEIPRRSARERKPVVRFQPGQ